MYQEWFEKYKEIINCETNDCRSEKRGCNGCYYNKINKALAVLKTKNDYIVPDCNLDEAIEVAIDFIEKVINN